MRKAIGLVAIVLSMSGCTIVKPGWVGIKVNNMGTNRGVQDYPIMTGAVWFNPFTETVHEFPTFLQTVVWTKSPSEGGAADESITFNSVEGASVNADISISYQFLAEKVPYVFVEFRKDPEEITDIYVRSIVRNSFSNHASAMKVVDIFGGGKQVLLDKVKKDLNDTLKVKGMVFDQVSLVGKVRVDKNVEDAVNAVIEASQRALQAENKVRQSKAEAEQKIAEAKGQAEAQRLLQFSLSPMVLQRQALDNQRTAIEKWNGQLPMYNGSGVVPFIQMQHSEK